MSDTYHVIVFKQDGTITRADKEKEASAVKSAKAYVTLRGETAAVVVLNGHIIFEIPEGTKDDKELVKKALAKAKSSSPAQAPSPAQAAPPAVVAPHPAKTKMPPSLKSLAAEYDAEMKAGTISIPSTKPKTKACDIEVLESACIAFSLSRCVPLDQAQKVCDSNRDNITILAEQMSQHQITKFDAITNLISTMQGSCVKPVKTTPATPTLDVTKILRGHGGASFKGTRIREDIGPAEMLVDDVEPLTLPEGIVIYTKKETDQQVHDAVAYAMGYTPNSLINMHHPAGIEGYDYRRALPLTRPTLKNPTWRAMGERIKSPGTLVKRLKEQFPTEQNVRIEVAQGVEFE